MEEAMTLEEFRAAKQTGVDLYAEPQQSQEDAAPEIEQEEYQEQQEVETQEVEQEEQDDIPQIPKEQQEAWKERSKRERLKGAEEATKELKKQHEAELAQYKRFFEASGINPDQAMQVLEQNRIKAESRNAVMGDAQRLAYQYGWDEEQTEAYIQEQSELISRQRQTENEMRDLRVSVAINDLSDKPDYPGIKGMKSQISEFIKQNPYVNVEQAYWAVGGASLAQQLKREAEQREIAKRSQPQRKVVSDNGKSSDNKGYLPAEAIDFMRRENLSEAQMRFMMNDDVKTLEDYRKLGRK